MQAEARARRFVFWKRHIDGEALRRDGEGFLEVLHWRVADPGQVFGEGLTGAGDQEQRWTSIAFASFDDTVRLSVVQIHDGKLRITMKFNDRTGAVRGPITIDIKARMTGQDHPVLSDENSVGPRCLDELVFGMGTPPTFIDLCSLERVHLA